MLANLSELELTLGEVSAAVNSGKQAVEFADHSRDAFQRMGKRTTHADALHQAGCYDQAGDLFAEAEELQAKRQPGYLRLYSLQGFRYCDLLLSKVERTARQCQLKLELKPVNQELLLAVCDEVAERSTQTLEWAEYNAIDLLSSALDHLTLGRVALYRAILTSGAKAELSTVLEPAATNLNAAVNGLRKSGDMVYLPRGLLSRAWLLFLQGTTQKRHQSPLQRKKTI